MTTTIALAGNPNVGKSTLFNALTGARQHVGNWPGKTVEKKEGWLQCGEEKILLVDLPGTYSLTAYSIEEIIARDFILDSRPTAVVAVIDAANLERNLYLVAQLMELEIPVILALNMSDVAGRRGMQISAGRLSKRLGGVPVIETVGNRFLGIEALKNAIAAVAASPHIAAVELTFSGILRQEFEALAARITATPKLAARCHPAWLATKLLENDPAVIEEQMASGESTLIQMGEAARLRIEVETGEEAETLIADQRYAFIGGVVDQVLVRSDPAGHTRSEQIDHIVTHRVWGLPIFLLMMWMVFQFTANVSAPLLDWVDIFINQYVHNWGLRLMSGLGLDGTWLQALLTEGIIAGLGGVLVFVPVLMFLYLGLGILEDSGYMARAAFVMDRVMRWMGLQGKSFLPMIVGFGCTVPAVYATRTLQNEKDRKLTGFLATFMSCGARLPVYVIFGAAFFGTRSGSLIFGMYLLGLVVALATGLTLKHTVYRSEPPAAFVMELPPYRLPRPKDVWTQMWERTRGFLIKAGTVILGVSMALWLLMAIPARPTTGSFGAVAPQDSLFGTVSGAVAPVLAPAGFGSWQAAGSLITGFLAKEVIVGTMNQLYFEDPVKGDAAEGPALAAGNVGDELVAASLGLLRAAALTVQEAINIAPRTVNLVPGLDVGELAIFPAQDDMEDTTRLEEALTTSFARSAGSPAAGPVAAVAFNVFVLLYIPCIAAVTAMRQEFGARWMWAQIGYTLALAWTAATLVFQAGRLLIG